MSVSTTTITIVAVTGDEKALTTVEAALTTDALSMRLMPVLRALKRQGVAWSLDRSPGEIRIDLPEPKRPAEHDHLPKPTAAERCRIVADQIAGAVR